MDFKCSHSDSSLFVKHEKLSTTILLVYVDDIIITSNSRFVLSHVITSLSRVCALKDLGRLNYFLGVEATFFSGGLFLNQ